MLVTAGGGGGWARRFCFVDQGGGGAHGTHRQSGPRPQGRIPEKKF